VILHRGTDSSPICEALGRSICSFTVPPDEPGVLRGRFSSEVGGNIYSKATGKWYR
jgi:hypothetical protein